MLYRDLIAYIERLRVGQGYRHGEPVQLWPWQRRFLKRTFTADVDFASLSIARGGGKTTLCAAVALAFLDAPGIAQDGSEIVIVSATQKQGAQLFDHVGRFIGRERDRFRIREYAHELEVKHRETGVKLSVFPARPESLHGSAPALTLLDEVAQWPRTKIDRMLAALETASGKIPGSRVISLGTRAATAGHAFETLIRSADYSQVHAARQTDPVFQRRTWERANPTIKKNPVLLDAYRGFARKAKTSPERLQAFKALRLNQGVSDILENYLADPDLWEAAEADRPAKGRCFWGLDLGQTEAASAVAAYYPASGRLESIAAFGNVPDLSERSRRDGAGQLYHVAHRRGEIVLLGERVVPTWQLLSVALRRFGTPSAIACDRWRVGELRDALSQAGISCPVEERGQGFRDGAADVRAFREALAGGKVAPVRGTLFLTACVSEARTISDPAGNHKLAKNVQGGRRQKARDDAAAAAILAVSLGVRRGADPVASWSYTRLA